MLLSSTCHGFSEVFLYFSYQKSGMKPRNSWGGNLDFSLRTCTHLSLCMAPSTPIHSPSPMIYSTNSHLKEHAVEESEEFAAIKLCKICNTSSPSSVFPLCPPLLSCPLLAITLFTCFFLHTYWCIVIMIIIYWLRGERVLPLTSSNPSGRLSCTQSCIVDLRRYFFTKH